jgi:hypothetical protein
VKLVFLIGLLFTACSVPVRKTSYFIAAGHGCDAVFHAARQLALASGYHVTPIPPSTDPRAAVALFEQRNLDVRFFREARECRIITSENGYSDTPVALAERQRLYSALQSRGFHSLRLQQEPYQAMIDVVPYAP